MRAWAIGMLLALATSPAQAQQAQPARLAVDTVVATDGAIDRRGGTTAGIVTDAMVSVALGRGFQAITRPFLQRVTATGEWNAQIWIAALRVERGRRVAVRIDAGYIPSPTGSANLLVRPHTNPTIALPSSLFTALPQLDAQAPRATLLGSLYPLGISGTASSQRWDVRAALTDSSPLRSRRVFADASPANPPRLRNIAVGGGITPVVGVRLGASLSHGPWQKAGEGLATSDRSATVATLEADLAYRHTHAQAEWTRDRIEVATGTVTASGWFVQADQTLAPRWFVAGRVERLRAPARVSGLGASTVRVTEQLTGTEETLGYRLTPELTLRGSHRMRELFGRTGFDQTAAVSVVWWRRWR